MEAASGAGGLALGALAAQALDQQWFVSEGSRVVDQVVEPLVVTGGGAAEALHDGLFLGDVEGEPAFLEIKHGGVTLGEWGLQGSLGHGPMVREDCEVSPAGVMQLDVNGFRVSPAKQRVLHENCGTGFTGMA